MDISRSIARCLAVLLAVALLAVLAAACNDGGGGGKTPEAGDTPQADESPEAEESPEADGGDGDGNGGNGGDDAALGDLEALAEEAGDGVIAKVIYSVNSQTDGGTFEGEWVLVQRPPDSRIEMASTEGGQETRTIIIDAGGKTYICTSTADDESCFASAAGAAGVGAERLDPFFNLAGEISADDAAVDIVDESQREIAGVRATCFTISGGLVSLGEGEVCFSDDGLLLFMRSDVDGASSTIEATSVSTDVTDEDFEPPYEIVELPEFDIPTPP